MNVGVADVLSKFSAYLGAAIALGSPNLAGLPILPKRLLRDAPHNRSAYNTFIRWIRTDLALTHATTVVDAGANHGDFARAASVCFPEATVFLFEPLPDLQPLLRRRAEHYAPRWIFEPVALGAEAGSMPMHTSAGDDAIGSLTGFSEAYHRMNPTAGAGRTIDVRVDALANFCARRDVQQIDLLKVDVEGFEFEVMRGAEDMLPRINAIIIEVSLVRQADGGSRRLIDMLDLLVNAGFALVDVKPSLCGGLCSEIQWKPLEFNILARR
jgi:FkbM family methyltransferase